MAEYKITLYGDPILRKKSKPVQKIDNKINNIIKNMYRVMKEDNGVGLAAPQIGVNLQIITLNIPIQNSLIDMTIINPKISKLFGKPEEFEEGCLSIPGINEIVIRPTQINLKARDKKLKPIEINADGLLARVLQHEIDHLSGILFVDKIGEKRFKKIKPKLDMLKLQQKGLE